MFRKKPLALITFGIFTIIAVVVISFHCRPDKSVLCVTVSIGAEVIGVILGLAIWIIWDLTGPD